MLGDHGRILQQIATLEDEHRALDHMLAMRDAVVDQLRTQRMKRRKLWLKDEISRLYSFIYPDGAA